MHFKHITNSVILMTALVLLLAACGGGDTSSTPAPSPTIQSGTVTVSTPGTAPIVVLTPTSQGGSISKQSITLADRTLTMEQVSQKPGADASSTAVSITITITDTSSAAIQNKSTFYQLVGAEGDAFGTQSSVTPGFYGSITSRQTRGGTITFQVPTGAAQHLQLLYRPEVATETVLVPLNK
jgi:Domain of unknown function (DUF4352)